MADYSQVAQVKPTGPSTDAFQHITPVPLANPGRATAAGLEALGRGATEAATFYDTAAADAAATQYQERLTEIMHGVPGRMVTGPDGKPTPDMGYMGLQGRAALDARADTDRRMDDLRKEIMGGLHSPRQAREFDNVSRRNKAFVEGRMGQHADSQAKVWYDQVDKASVASWGNHIAMNAENPQAVIEGREELRKIHVQRAERMGGGPELIKAAVESADRQAVEAQASAIAVRDPMKAMRIIENNKAALGTRYDELANHFRARAETQEGVAVGDRLLSGAPPPKGDDAASVLRHFEGFREKPYPDTDGKLRVGYGSDTITKADGTVAPVTSETVVSREDAERDLARRVAQSQGQVKQAIGNEAWSKLSPQAQASLTSVAYNYGRVPDEIAAAAKSGGDIGGAIRSLAKHNNGINAGRRASEANNIAPGEAIPRTQADLMNEVYGLHLAPQAEAAAISRINHAYQVQRKDETQRNAAFKQRVDDSTAEAMQTGLTTNPVTEADFTKHFGPADGPAKYADYAEDIKFGADYKSLQTMSDTQQTQFLNGRMPALGAPGYARAIKNQDRLQKAVGKIQEQRRDDPAGSVSQQPAVMEAYAKVNPKDPTSFRTVADARLAAQEAMGIDEEFRSPITKTEALKMTAPLRRVIAGDTRGIRDALDQMGKQFREMFGNKADEAFAYAIRAHKVDAEVSQQAATVFRKLRNGDTLLSSDAKPLDDAKERAAADRAVRGFPSPGLPAPARPRVIGNHEGEAPQEGPPVIKPNPIPPAAIEFLLKNPGADSDFDKKYGTGLAQEIRKKYPVTPSAPGAP